MDLRCLWAVLWPGAGALSASLSVSREVERFLGSVFRFLILPTLFYGGWITRKTLRKRDSPNYGFSICRARTHYAQTAIFLLLVQRILSNWQFDLFISLIALLPKPRRSHRYACVCEAALSGKYSASNYPKLNFRCTSADSCGSQVSYAFCKQNQENFFSKPVSVCLGVFCKTKPAKFRKREYPALEQRERRSRKGSADFDFAEI